MRHLNPSPTTSLSARQRANNKVLQPLNLASGSSNVLVLLQLLLAGAVPAEGLEGGPVGGYGEDGVGAGEGGTEGGGVVDVGGNDFDALG